MICESPTTPDCTTTLNLRIPASPEYGRLVRERLASFAAEHRLDPDALREFVTAVGEAFANAVEHSSSNVIEVESWLDGADHLVTTVTDVGCGFVRIPDDHALPPPSAERGRGLAIMQRYSDVFTIRSEPGKGTQVLLGRSLSSHRRAGY
jgi:anti-sigma regulatory factor (Ser/Thr protein kinase)